jgi:ribosomal protein L7/L12
MTAAKPIGPREPTDARSVELTSGNTAHHVTGEWFFESDDPRYFLAMDHWTAELNQMLRVDLMREEYLALKECLGRLRGFTPGPEQEQAGPAPVITKKTKFSIILTSVGSDKIEVIKAVRAVTGLDLKEAKNLTDGAPKTIKEGVGRKEAEVIKMKFAEIGAAIELR